MPDDPERGCGISKWWLTPPDDPFFPACAWHDGAYEQGSPQQTMGITRSQVDFNFLQQMLSIAKTDTALLLRAYAYYEIARLLGASYYEGKQ